MTIWLRRVLREAAVLISFIVTAAFGANDALDMITWNAVDRWGFLIAFFAFGLLAMGRLVRLQERLDNRERFQRALGRLTPHIDSGQEIIDECGRPREQMHGAPPTYFLDHCLPRINEWVSRVRRDIEECVPEYLSKFQYFGNVTYDTEQKPAPVQSLEKRLGQLADITDELRRRMHDA
jgi:hypothetical protein